MSSLAPRPRGVTAWLPASLTLAATLALLGFAAVAAPAGCAKTIPCQLNSDCSDSYCSDGVCKKDCADAEADCPRGYICDAYARCMPPDGTTTSSTGAGGNGGSGPASSSSMASVTSVTTGASTSGPAGTGGFDPASSSAAVTGASSSSSSGSGSGTGQRLDPCTSDASCASPLLCRALSKGGEMRCTPACTTNAQCPYGLRCDNILGEQYCSAIDVGKPCTAANQCNFACLTSQQYCTDTCATGADCPNGYGCMSGVGGSASPVCVKVEAPCGASTAACIAASACDDQNLIVSGCFSLCNTAADCPQRASALAPWTCESGICLRPADVLGPVATAVHSEWACVDGVMKNMCNDALHIDFQDPSNTGVPPLDCNATTTTAGLGDDVCVDSCRYSGGCAFGSSCVGIGSYGGQRIGLCVPEGAGEVGAPCTADNQCAFGLCLAAGTCSRDCTGDGVCPGGLTCVAGGGPNIEGLPYRRCQ